MTLDTWSFVRLLAVPALALGLVAAVQADSIAAEALPAVDQVQPDAKPAMIRSATTCGNNYPTCGNDAACPAGYPTCIDAAGACYCHGTGIPPKSREPAPL